MKKFVKSSISKNHIFKYIQKLQIKKSANALLEKMQSAFLTS